MTKRNFPSRHARLKKNILIFIGVLLTLNFAFEGWSLWKGYHSARSSAERRLASHASALAEHATVTFTSAEWSLDYVRTRLGGKSPLAKSEKELYDLLKETVDHFPQFGSIILFDHEGNLLANSLGYPIKKVNNADRDYFRFQHANPSHSAMHFSTPYKSRVDNVWRFMLSKKLSRSDGSFAGLVGVSFNVHYFDDFYRQINIGDSARIALFRSDAQTLVRSPLVEEALVAKVTNSPLFSVYLPHTSIGQYVDKSAGYDQSHRLISFRQLAKYPVVAAVSQLHSEIYEPWQKELIGSLISFVILLVLAAALGYSLLRRLSAHESAETALLESEKRYRSLIESSFDWVWEVNQNCTYTYASPRVKEILGYTPDELIGRSPFDLMPLDEAKRVKEVFTEICAKRESFTALQNTNLHKNGQLIILETSGTPIIDSAGEFQGYRGFDRDITERKRAEQEREKLHEQLIQSQKMESVGRLAGGVAHDYNNMLAVIFIAIELMKGRIKPDDPAYEHIKSIENAAMRSSDITRQLLAFSRKQLIAPRHTSLNALINEIVKSLARLIGEDIDLKVSLDARLGHILIDPSQIDQILVNLVVNARDAMPNGGNLTIETSNITLDERYCSEHPECAPGHYVCLTVTDDGIGMDRQTLANIFEPFFTTKDVGKGTGLGLATVFGIVQQNHGFIRVYSEPGHGTSFKLYFPRVQMEDAVLPEPESDELPRGNERILLVEDDELLCRMTAKTLESLGYIVTAAKSPLEAISAVERRNQVFDILITDVVMPGMNGAQLRDRILSFQPDMKVLFMSGYTSDAIVHRGVLDEGISFIQKPFTVHGIAQKIRHVLSNNPTH